MDERKIIANNIRAERTRVRLSQEEVAKCLGITRETYNKFEQGKKIDSVYLYKLSLLFGCPIDSFFIGFNPTNCG